MASVCDIHYHQLNETIDNILSIIIQRIRSPTSDSLDIDDLSLSSSDTNSVEFEPTASLCTTGAAFIPGQINGQQVPKSLLSNVQEPIYENSIEGKDRKVQLAQSSIPSTYTIRRPVQQTTQHKIEPKLSSAGPSSSKHYSMSDFEMNHILVNILNRLRETGVKCTNDDLLKVISEVRLELESSRSNAQSMSSLRDTSNINQHDQPNVQRPVPRELIPELDGKPVGKSALHGLFPRRELSKCTNTKSIPHSLSNGIDEAEYKLAESLLYAEQEESGRAKKSAFASSKIPRRLIDETRKKFKQRRQQQIQNNVKYEPNDPPV